MKLVVSTVILFGALLHSAFVTAECVTNRNADILITRPDSLYTDHDDTVSDNKVGLMWQKCTLGLTGPNCATEAAALILTWQAALAAANENTDYGYSDWRLPNKNELESLLEDACFSPAINETLFPNTQSNPYWSSSPYAGNSASAWGVNFLNGYVGDYDKYRGGYVRLVRDSQ